MSEIVFATRNTGKKREFALLMKEFDLTISSLDHFNDVPNVVEDGATFKENAEKKALEIAKFTNKLTVADDSGLEVWALENKPGVYSSRFAGDAATDKDNNKKLLEVMKNIPLARRGASFRCAISIATPEGVVGTVEGSCDGVIGFEEKGFNGFGYDPLFIRNDYGKTFAELEDSIKNRISHRARAFEKAKMIFERILG
ncbi:MAG: XTP/dITP diphosphatase [Candidatus Ancaeobacter aquaticus]|nr:XTP/dITP diphosphatase [Candidatus Ancaeobacter aquaticus]